MGKNDSYIIKRFCSLRLHYYLLLWSICRIYYAAPEMLKISDSTAVDSSDDDDEMDYSSESYDGEIDW